MIFDTYNTVISNFTRLAVKYTRSRSSNTLMLHNLRIVNKTSTLTDSKEFIMYALGKLYLDNHVSKVFCEIG